MSPLWPAPEGAASSYAPHIVAAANAWASDQARPRADAATLAHWERLLDEWVAAEDLPLFVRKARDNRGQALPHRSGRTLIPTDNSPAHWSVVSAFSGERPTLLDVRELLRRDRLPIAMVLKRAERESARYRCTRGDIDNPNQLGWKVAHIEDVGLGNTVDLLEVDLSALAAHHRRFLSPSNIFLVPKAYAGVAETPEFIEAFRTARDSPC